MLTERKNSYQEFLKNQVKFDLSVFESIYISPLEGCNLACKYCYTQKTSNILSDQQILDFVSRYSCFIHESYSLNLKSIILCGGEVFLLPNFPQLINTLIDKDIFVTVITNGTIDRLSEIKNPQNCQILVSLDGPKAIHDQNRGDGNFNKSIKYIKHAQELGFPVGIMFLVTKDSYPYKDSFLPSLYKLYNLPAGRQGLKNLELTYLTDRKMSLTNEQSLDIKLHYPTFPSKDFGCYQLSLQSDGNITGCCESSISLGKITDEPQVYVSKFIDSLSKCFSCPMSSLSSKIYHLRSKCHGCCDPNYLCGYPKEFHQNSCQNIIIKLFNKNKNLKS